MRREVGGFQGTAEARRTFEQIERAERTVGLLLNCPAWFEDRDFLAWLNTPSPWRLSWHEIGTEPHEYSDVVVLVDPACNGEGTEGGCDQPSTDVMPARFRDAVVAACRAHPGEDRSGCHYVVRITNL